jgi:pantoate--beta-alanine ligase
VKTEAVHSIEEIQRILSGVRRAGRSISLVPTMGALHAGHGRLIETARRESDFVVASIFVNPTQFDRDEDYSRYPRTLAGDMEFCAARGVDAVFAPTVEEIYPRPQRAFVEVHGVSEHLCGRFRPGHFRGVATVVLKLLNIIRPDRAYFGEKDIQQLAVVRRMAADLNVSCAIVEVPTVREADGLALSSRNGHLSAGERLIAPVLRRALQAAEALITAGATNADEIRHATLRVFEQHPEVRVEYLEIVDPDEMQPVAQIAGPVRVAGAVWIGKTRLIDNVMCIARPAQAANR